jgi:hypothetical protein
MRKDARIVIRGMRGVPGQPHVFSMWVKTPAPALASITPLGLEASPPSYGGIYPGLPSTNGKWRHLSYYFLLPAQAETCEFQVQVPANTPPDAMLCFDSPGLRTATWHELALAYDAEHTKHPHCDNRHAEDAGQNLALSVAKWQGKAGLPGKAFVIWALGSNWTHFLGNGMPLLLAIRQNFPDAPPLVYKKHTASDTHWDFAAGWARQFVGAEQPDLVLSYTNGSPVGLDAFLTQIRRQTTADIMIGSLHFFRRDKLQSLTDDFVEQDWSAARKVCRKHGAQFVENRRELADYLIAHKLEPSVLLNDAVHQNTHGRLRTWDAFCRRIASHPEPAYDPATREHRIPIAKVRTADGGTRIHVPFTGNRIDIIGRKSADGGKATVYIDGKFAQDAPAWKSSYIKPDPQNAGLLKGPHAVTLGQGLQAQTWTITMTSDSGDFELAGSTSGPDGVGNALRPFTSDSGQIRIDPALWPHAKPESGNAKGDRFTFTLSHAARSVIDFSGDGPFAETIVQQLNNGPHTLDLLLDGDAEIEAFYVFTPPLK